MLRRVHHNTWGPGVVIAEQTSESGSNIARVVFDADPATERTIVATFLNPSDQPLPAVAKKAAKRKTRQAKSEPVPDKLLVAVPDPYLADDSEIHESVIE